MMDYYQEKELVEKATADSEAFGILYDTYYSRIFGYILRRTADIAVTQDITSEVFLKALKNIGSFRWKAVPFSAWLYRIANNAIADHYRSNGRNSADSDILNNSIDHAGPSPETEMVRAEEHLRKHEDFLVVHRLLQQLPRRYQEVITLRFFENKKLSEIAEILGKREGTVKSLLHRGLEKLRLLMEEHAGMPESGSPKKEFSE